MRLAFLFVACASLSSPNDTCEALCQRDGYTTGRKYRAGCECIDIKPNLKDFILRRASLGPPDIEPIAPFKKENEKSGTLYVSPWGDSDR